MRIFREIISPMGKTIEVARDRAFDQKHTVLPTEVARGVYIEHPPSAQALKLMHLLIATAGGRMADEVRHEIRLSDMRKIEGMRNHDRTSLRALFTQLRAAVLVYNDTKAQTEIIGGVMDEIRLDYRHEVSDDLLIKWWFGRTFRQMAADSNHWAILDRQTIFSLSSKYSILLFQHISSLVNLDYVTSKVFSLPELRAVLGVEEGKLERFADLNRWAIIAPIEEINQLSRLHLTATARKVGRTVTSVEIAWAIKADPKPVKRELDRPKVGRKARRDGTAEASVMAFPASGSIRWTPWEAKAREHAPRPTPDMELISAKFRDFCVKRGLSLNTVGVERAFIGWISKFKV